MRREELRDEIIELLTVQTAIYAKFEKIEQILCHTKRRLEELNRKVKDNEEV